MQLSDRVALITGGASGLGRGIAAIMAQRGASVAVADIDTLGADETAAAIASDGGDARAPMR